MAFTGTAVVTKITDTLVRITGLSLAGAAAGTIGISGSAGTVQLPDACEWGPQGDVTLSEAMQVTIVPVDAVTTLIPISVTKTDAGVITLTNTSDDTNSAELEIYVRYR